MEWFGLCVLCPLHFTRYNMVSEVMEQLKPPQHLSFEGNLAENWKEWLQGFRLYNIKSTRNLTDSNPGQPVPGKSIRNHNGEVNS